MTHSPVKQMLKEAGLKMSLARLKVIDALWEASGEQGRVPIRTLHRRLSETGTPLSLVSIRQVLGRLVESGLVTLSPGKASWGGAAGSAAPERRAAANEQRL
ncbi:transcriptional repressor [Pseudomonas aeruginosa]|uniref:transcriptional repressor n=1 Tax=Pseudomonas aeruginosa TaxID=287 RepID=UPI0015E6E466|nr:transcriptional repressor [Pseudomonas aeruginosa]